MITKYRSKIEEDETKNVNWNKHFDKLKEMHSGEQDSNEIKIMIENEYKK